uniref:uncharacterized protein PFB0145c-like n=1 Tax=Erigeron canadensis TaxID=72917 RepID=UPI001CB9247F|nr:uncharacterized protein PFB0145c-like [Erigeron canadensis]
MTSSSPPPEPWGTWDELLLAYAVNRYGTKNWDSISSELRKRTPDPTHITPLHCQQKYSELNRRFNHTNQNDVVLDDDDNNNNDVIDEVSIDNNNDNNIPWLKDLRRQRVLELQTQLQNYDLYISKLQSKVKKLKEEHEKSLDLDNENEPEKPEKEDEKVMVKFPATERVVSGEGERSDEDETVSDRDNQSVNGSNGNVNMETEGKLENGKEPGPGEEKGGPVEVETVKSEPGEGERTAGEKENVGMKENSDVQSSASKSKKEERGGDRIRRGSAVSKDEDRDEDEEDDQSTDSIPVRSLPLVDFLARLHKVGSALFDRPRLDRQEKQRYKNLIRQHIDYEILQARLKEGWYSDGNDKFFRDLLLFVNNTRVFFPKESQESTAAMDLRQLILKEMMSKRKLKTESKLMDKQTSLKLANLPSKRASEPPDSLLHKPILAVPMVVCRKRSSITAKAAASSSGLDKRKEQPDLKSSEKLDEEKRETPKRSSDSFSLITKKKGKSIEKNPGNETSNTKTDKKKLTEAEEKKQSAAKFLNRMKRSNNEPLLNTLRSTSESGGNPENDGKGGGEHKRSGNKGGGEGKKDQASKKSSGGRQRKDSPAKRNVGRPPKRVAARSPLSGTLGKRNRELGDSETLVTKQTKKRSKR